MDEDNPVARRSDLLALDKRFDETAERFEATVAKMAEDTKRHFDVVAEQIRADFKVVADKTVATGEKVDRLIASNAIEHAAFVEAVADHEVRLRVLEALREPEPGSRKP